jgi:hypothetical protein
MGDPFTKFMLSAAQEYVYQRVRSLHGPHTVASVVGDDLVVLSNHREVLESYLQQYVIAGFKISELDTMISREIIYYCEEASQVPQTPSEALTVKLKRGEGDFTYLDYPRLRLLIATHPDVFRHSYTDTGRVELLNKEYAWVHKWKSAPVEIFERAALLQRVLVPRSSETIHPCLPVWLGGDGGYFHRLYFLKHYMETHSWDLRETAWRLKHLIEDSLSVAYTRTEKVGRNIHRYHNVMAMAEALNLVPQEFRFPVTDATRPLWMCFKGTQIMTPPQAAFKFLEKDFWEAILRGEDPPEPPKLEKYYPHVGNQEVEITIERVIELQKSIEGRLPRKEEWPWLVDMSKIARGSYLALKWEPIEFPVRELWTLFTDGLLDVRTACIETIYRDILADRIEIPQPIMDRLNLFFSTDPVLIWSFAKEIDTIPTGKDIALISKDGALARTVCDMVKARHYVWLVDPIFYLVGMMPAQVEDAHLLVDSGARLWADMHYFQDGAVRPEYEDMIYNRVFCGEVPIFREPNPLHRKPASRYGLCLVYRLGHSGP